PARRPNGMAASTISATHPGRRALITGASSGIGAAFATALARRGVDLVLVARSTARLAELAAQVRSQHRIGVELLAADLTDAGQRRAVEVRLASDTALDILVHSAGAAGVGRFAALGAEEETARIALNVIAAVRLARAVVPGMVARRQGAIIVVSSI